MLEKIFYSGEQDKGLFFFTLNNWKARLLSVGIATRLALYIVIFSTIIALISTLGQLYIDYTKDIKAIKDRFIEFQSSQLPILTNSVWVLDDKLIQTQLSGLVRLPDIEFLKVYTQDELKWSAGTEKSKNLLTQRYDLIHKDKNREIKIGVLEINASIDNIYSRLLDQTFSSLFSNGIKALSVAAFILIIFQSTVTRHLYHLATYANNIDLKNPTIEKLTLDRPKRRVPDVLDRLGQSMETMRRTLTTAYAATRRDEERIRRENESLSILLRHDGLRGEQISDNYSFVTKTVCDALTASRVGLWRFDLYQDCFTCLDLYDLKTDSHQVGMTRSEDMSGAFIATLQDEKILAARDARKDPRYRDFFANTDYRSDAVSIIDAGVQIDGRLDAIITVEHTGTLREWAADEVSFISAVAAVLAASIEAHDKQIAQRELSSYKDHLEEMIATRTSEVTKANAELSSTLDMLRSTQNDLVEREKLASLGSVVAGVAHEVNTPIGVGVTAASSLRNATRKITEKMAQNEMKKSDLVSFFDTAVRSTEIIEANLMRAAELVRSFKLVAVDQSSETRREIDLESYLNDVMISLRPELRKAGHTSEVIAGEKITLETTPSAIWQIVSNLVMNSIIHAYGPGDHGIIRLSATKENDNVLISYKDNGKGMSDEVRRRVFEPFYTTKRGQGGSGLGLSIVYNLVTKSLDGTISCNSTEGEGTEFLIAIPTSSKNGVKND